MDAGELVVDHKNGQALNNRKCNLRWTTREKNNANRRGEFLVEPIAELAARLVAEWRQAQPS